MECARLGPDKVHGVEITTFLARLPKRRFDRYAICFFTSTDLVCVADATPDANLSSAHCRSLVFKGATVTQHRPDNACQLGGERDDHDVGVSPREQLVYPCADPRGCLGKMRQSGASAMDQLGPQVFVTPLADPEEFGPSASRVLSRC